MSEKYRRDVGEMSGRCRRGVSIKWKRLQAGKGTVKLRTKRKNRRQPEGSNITLSMLFHKSLSFFQCYFNTVSNIILQAGKGAQKFLCSLSGLEALPLVWEHLSDNSPTCFWLAKLEVAHLFVTAKKTFCGTVGMSESRQPSGISVSVDSVHLIMELTSFLWLSQHHSRSIGLLYAYTGTNN